jgi:predicted metal-binding protein
MYLTWLSCAAFFAGMVTSVPLNKLSANDIIRVIWSYRKVLFVSFQVREQFMQETLSKPKYAEMRASMERRARAPPRVFDQPMNPELEKRVKVVLIHYTVL